MKKLIIFIIILLFLVPAVNVHAQWWKKFTPQKQATEKNDIAEKIVRQTEKPQGAELTDEEKVAEEAKEELEEQQERLERIKKQQEITQMQHSLDEIRRINELNAQQRRIEEIQKINQMQKILEDIKRINQQKR